jgi:hypothetical protein
MTMGGVMGMSGINEYCRLRSGWAIWQLQASARIGQERFEPYPRVLKLR